jgi:GGDEF domain-containing protein
MTMTSVAPARDRLSILRCHVSLPRYSPAPLEEAVARDIERLAGELRVAALHGDDTQLKRPLTELLRFGSLPKSRLLAVQRQVLLNLVQSLRCAALTDPLTGLYARRGFLQSGARLLDVAVREQRAAYMIYMDMEPLDSTKPAPIAELRIRELGNCLRDVFRDYGVYEVLGRLGSYEFVALTTHKDRGSILASMLHPRGVRMRNPSKLPATLRVGVAQFSPRDPLTIEELLEDARRAAAEQQETRTRRAF